MDIQLRRRPHPNPSVRASGINPTDPYLEWCWGPVVGPSTTALVRRVAELTADSDEVHVPFTDLSRLLGLGSGEPTRNHRLIRTLARAEQFGLAFTSVGVPGPVVTFGIYDQVALVPHRLLQRLPEIAQQHHAAAVLRVNEALEAHGLPILRSPLPDAGRTPGRPMAPAGVSAPATPERAGGRPPAVSPTARLEAIAASPRMPLEQSL